MELEFQPPLPPQINPAWSYKYTDPRLVPRDFYDMYTVCQECDKRWGRHRRARCWDYTNHMPTGTTFRE